MYAWKRRYNYSSNDERFTTATLTQILEDELDQKAVEFLLEYESYDDETNEFLKKRELDPQENVAEQKRLQALADKYLKK